MQSVGADPKFLLQADPHRKQHMHYTTLGRTGLRVSVAGLGTGGFSRMGLKSGKTEDEAARLVLRGGRARRQFHRHRAALRHRGCGRPGAEIDPARQGGGGDQKHRSPQRRMVVAGTRGREPRQFAAPHGHRLCRRVQSACGRSVHVRIRARHAGARASRTAGEGQDPAYRAHRESDPRSHQRDAQARGERSRLGGVHGGLPHDAPGRADQRVSGDARKRASAR